MSVGVQFYFKRNWWTCTCDSNNSQWLHAQKSTVRHESCIPDVGDSGFVVGNANHKAEITLVALSWQRL
jgi:hypothetical protein